MSITKYLCSLLFFVVYATAIWPIPSSYTHGNTTLWIDPDLQIMLNGLSKGYPQSPSEQILATAIERTKQTIFQQNFVPWKFHPRNAEFEPELDASACYVKSLTLSLNKTESASTFNALAGDIDECYTLTISDDGQAEITANSAAGLSHGLTTFTQLFYAHSTVSDKAYTPFAPVSITDSPKFVHRGINMDVARNYFPLADIKRQIDAASYVKMNRFHIHITDGQSWPLVIPSLPELSEKGAYRKELVYTPENVRDLQLYGALRGVQVYLETDMPGHTSSIHYSHPELIASFNIQPDWNTYAAEPPSGTLKLNSPAVSTFLETMFNDLLPRLKDFTAYYHTGGDEVNVNAYKNDDTVASNDSAVIQPFMQKFIDRNHDQVRAAGFAPIVWQEMLVEWNLTLGKDVVVQSWKSDEDLLAIVRSGHKALAGNYNYWYLDCGSGQWLNFNPGASSQQYYPYTDYCSPRKSWRLVYAYDPLNGIPSDLQHLVLGGEAHIWAEQTDPVNIDRMVWPRAAAAAEVLWSGAKDPGTGANRSQVEAAPRLSEMRERLVARGVGAEPIQMPFCLMGVGQCSL